MSSARRPLATPPQTSNMTPAQAERARRVAELAAAWELLLGQHRLEFPPVAQPGRVVPEPVPMFSVLLSRAERTALEGVGRLDREGRRAARQVARTRAEAEALELLQAGHADVSARQAAADSEWVALVAGDPRAVRSALTETFDARGVPVVVEPHSSTRVELVLSVPGEEAVPTHEPDVTRGGAPTAKKLTKTAVAGHVREIAAARVLLAAKEAFAASPATADLIVRAGFDRGPTVLRAALSRAALARVPWSMSAWDVLRTIDPDLEVNLGGRTKELRPLPD